MSSGSRGKLKMQTGNGLSKKMVLPQIGTEGLWKTIKARTERNFTTQGVWEKKVENLSGAEKG